MLKPKIASMPLARQWSYIRKTTSSGKLLTMCQILLTDRTDCPPVAEHCQKPLRAEHARFDSLPKKMNMKDGKQFLDQTIKLFGNDSVQSNENDQKGPNTWN